MVEKSNYNMIMSIMAAIITIPLLVLGIVFQNNTLTIVLMSIYYFLFIIHFILNSIYYKTTNKAVDIVSNSILDFATTLVTINFLLLLTTPYKWILFAMMCLLGILEIASCSLSVDEVRYLLSAIKLLILLFTVYSITGFALSFILLFFSVVIGYMTLLLGRILHNKIYLSFDIVSLVLFGIFLLLI